MNDWFFYFLSTRHLTKENNFGIDDPKAGASKKFYLYDVSKCAHVVVLFQDVNVLTATYRNGVVVSVISAVIFLIRYDAFDNGFQSYYQFSLS